MAPNVKESDIFNHGGKEYQMEKLVAPQADSHKFKLIDYMIFVSIYIVAAGIYGVTFIPSAKWSTLIFIYIYFVYGFMGITAGVHRFWSHKSFKAKFPIQILLMLAHSSLSQFSIIWWSETHRLHHKYSDTDGDPSNSTRGLFFCHIGWLLVERHPKAVEREPFVDNSDIRNDPLLVFQRKYSIPIIAIMSVILPSSLPLLWGEYFTTAYHLNMLRLFISYNLLFTVNSVGHTWGSRPYDKHIKPADRRFLSFLTLGEAYHNFHHVFPWDYKGGEWGGSWNFTTLILEGLAKIGWVYDLKTVPREVVDARAGRNGDGSRHFYNGS